MLKRHNQNKINDLELGFIDENINDNPYLKKFISSVIITMGIIITSICIISGLSLYNFIKYY